MANLALLDLVLPYIFRGESLGPSHAALSVLRVVTYESSNDDLGVTIRGHCEVNGSLDFFPGQGVLVAGGVDEATPAHDPSRSDPVFDLRDTTVDFELFVPRAASAIVASAQPTFGPGASATGALFTDWTAAPGDYPSTGFTFDLILNAPKLRPPFLHPAKVSTIGVLEPDPSVNEVAITLPRMRFRISHGNPLGSQLVFAFVAAGVSDLDDPGSVEVSQFITMEPPYAYIGGQDDHVVGIGFRSATLDLDGDWTPPALRDKAQVGDDWTGLYLPEVRVFVSPDGLQNLAFECGAQELLIGVDRTSGIWGDFDAKLVQQGAGELRVMPRFTEPGGREYGVTPGAVVAGVRQATVALPQATTMVIDVTGGRTPYARVVRINGTAQPSATQYDLDLGATGTATVDLEVTSGSPTTPVARMHITVTRLVETPRLPTPASPSSSTTTAQPATIESETGFDFELVQGPGDSVTILVVPPVEGLAWSDSSGPIVSGNPPTQVHGSSVTTQVVGGTTRSITATRAGASGTTLLDYFFFYDSPGGVHPMTVSTTKATDAAHATWTAGSQDPISAYAHHFDALPDGATITVSGDASYEGHPERKGYNTSLAWRRANRVATLIGAHHPAKHFVFDIVPHLADPQNPTTPEQDAWATSVGWTAHSGPVANEHWRATVSVSASTPAQNGVVSVKRLPPTTTTVTVTRPPADPPPPEHAPPPDWFRSAGVKVRVVDSQLIALQLDLEIDMQTLTEDKLASGNPIPGGAALPRGRTLDHGTPVGPDNPADGITAFRVLVQTDPATGRYDTLLTAGADPADTDGLWHLGWIPQVDPPPTTKDLALTFLGSYLSFWPLIAAVPPVDAIRSAAEGRESAVADVALSGAALAVPAIVAAIPWFQVERVILFGAEYFHTQRDGGFTGTLLADLEVDWSMNILDGLVVVPKERPLKVRYKALGLRLTNRDDGAERWDFLPVFDASRGFTIDVASGGGMRIGEPLGQILRILGARLSRSNPMTLEVDIALGIDLGVVAVDQASVRAYLDEARAPELTALSARVDIPGALVGSGYMRIGTSADGTAKTIGGQIDLTLRPVNVRVAAALEIATITDGGREATGVYIGLNVVLPAGIPLGSTGLGIFGFRGIFGMHYRRTQITGPNASVPALEWLKASGGQPHLLKAPGPTGPVLWEPKIDNWAFGIGILIGTMEGGVLINLDGTFLLELPGPRVLIMLNARILVPPPSVDGMGQKGGVLAVIEITPEHFLIGIILQWEIEKLIKIVIPVEAVFPFGSHANEWHIYLGARSDYGPSIEVDVLGIVTGTGYLMFRGNGIQAFDNGHGALPAIKGFGIGLGVAASFTWGDVDAGLYLRLGGGMDAVLGFDPFILAGNIWVAGELRLWIISIGADALLEVVVAEQGALPPAPDGTPRADLSLYVHGKACGHVDFFFFSVSGCVEITISGPKMPAAIPTLVEKVSLQSRSPALAQGSGVDKGIDVSLGTAGEGSSYPGDANTPVVPIDAFPVISMLVPPSPDGSVTIGGLEVPLTAAPGVDPSGYAERSGDHYRYRITAMRLERVKGNGQVDPVTLLGGTGTTNAPASWWSVNSATDANATAQLALLTWQATPATKAIEYTDRLVEDITRRWGDVCTPAAPPAEVLWTFKLERIGPSDAGWDLQGVAWPDPADSQRSTPVDTGLDVSEPWRTGDPAVDGLRGVVPAVVIGSVVECRRKQARPGDLVRGSSLAAAVSRPALAALPRVVLGGAGPIDDTRPSGSLLPADDLVRSMVAPLATSMDVRISPAFHAKATAAAQGLRELAAAGSAAPSLASLLAGGGAPLGAVALDRAVLAHTDFGPGVAAPAAEARRPGTRCPVKVLQSPLLDFGLPTNLPDELLFKRLGRHKEDNELIDRVHLHTGPYAAMSLLLYVPGGRTRLKFAPVIARVLDAKGDELDRVEVTAADLLSGGAALPPRWTDLAGPWGNDIDDLVRWGQGLGVPIAWLKVPDHKDAAVVELGLPRSVASGAVTHVEAAASGLSSVPSYYVAAASLVSGAEVARFDWDTTQVAQDRTQLTNAVGPASTTHSLLKADSRYRLTVEWYADRQGEAGSRGTAGAPVVQSFWFRTDTIETRTLPGPSGAGDPPRPQGLVFTDTPEVLPVRLDPWVMVTLPDEGEKGYFGGEPLRVVFNTHDVDRLFTEHGKELRLRIEAANGQHPAGTSAVPMPLPITSSTLTLVESTLVSPWEKAAGEAFDRIPGFCVQVDGTKQTHATLDIPLPLDMFMDHILDIECVPVGSPASTRGPSVFRRHFTTGEFRSRKGLAWSLWSVLPSAKHAAAGTFATVLGAVGTHPAGSALDSALMAAGLEPLGPPDVPRVVVFWEQAGSALPQPAAVLIDATEPLSRSRTYPKEITDTTTSASATRWILQARQWLTVRTGGDAGVVRDLIWAPGDQRVLIVLNPGARGKRLTADLVQLAMPDLPFLDPGEQAFGLTDLTFTAAPWEEA
jgi:large repetitive protein